MTVPRQRHTVEDISPGPDAMPTPMSARVSHAIYGWYVVTNHCAVQMYFVCHLALGKAVSNRKAAHWQAANGAGAAGR